MKISNYINLLLTLALVGVSVRYAIYENEAKNMSDGGAQPESVVAEDCDAIDNILTRRSVRSYTDEEVSDEDVETLLRAAMAAPTARDARPWHFVTITDSETLQSIADAMPNAKMAADAPLAIAVCGVKSKMLDGEGADYWIQDCSAASENILLAAHALGLGAVWCGVWPLQERVTQTREILSLDDDLVPLCIIVAGHPDGDSSVKDKWDEGNVTYLE